MTHDLACLSTCIPDEALPQLRTIHIHDGNQMSRWLSKSYQLNNTLDFQFDVNEDGITGGKADLFTMENFYLQNYGNDDISIKEFQIEH